MSRPGFGQGNKGGMWGFSASGNTSALQAEMRSSILLTSTKYLSIMEEVKFKMTISGDAVMSFSFKASHIKPHITIYGPNPECPLCRIDSYREYLDMVNASRPDWPLQTQHEIYKWMREAGWL